MFCCIGWHFYQRKSLFKRTGFTKSMHTYKSHKSFQPILPFKIQKSNRYCSFGLKHSLKRMFCCIGWHFYQRKSLFNRTGFTKSMHTYKSHKSFQPILPFKIQKSNKICSFGLKHSLKRMFCCIGWHFYQRKSLFKRTGFTKSMHTYKSHNERRRRNEKTRFRNKPEKRTAFQ